MSTISIFSSTPGFNKSEPSKLKNELPNVNFVGKLVILKYLET